MTQYPDHIAIAQKLLEQQGEINRLTADLEQTEIAFEKRGQTITRLEGKLQQAEADVLAWQRACIDAHPETGTVELLDAAAQHWSPSCRWPACLSEAEQQQLADEVGASTRGEETVPGPDPRPGCGCVDRGYGGDLGSPELTRDELQDLVDEQGADLYKARDLIAFVREMCDSADRDGSPVTTERVRTWLAYTGCGGVLTLPPDAVAALATMSGERPDKAATSSDAPGIAGES